MRVSGTDEEGRDQYADDRHYIGDEFRCLESGFGFNATSGGNTGRLRTLGRVAGGGFGRWAEVGLEVGLLVVISAPSDVVEVCRPVLRLGCSLNRWYAQIT